MSLEIEVSHLYKNFGPRQALSGVSVVFGAQRMHGLIGPEGAGKTTLLRHVAGLLQPSAGVIEFKEKKTSSSLSQSIERAVPFAEIRAHISYMPQQPCLYPDLSIQEHLDFFRALYELSNEDFERKKTDLLNMTRLGPFLDRPARKLSGGMYKKLGLMCALISSPKILLLDEPTNGVDPISRREFWDLLYQLHQQGILIVFATAYMDEAERCTEVHLINKGKILKSGEPKNLLMETGVVDFNEFFIELVGEA